VKPGGQGALDIPQNTLEHRKVRLSRVVHEEANLLNLFGIKQEHILLGFPKGARKP